MNTIIVTPSPSIGKSLEFYRKLGFQEFKVNDHQMVYDGQVCIEINTDKYVRAGIKISRKDWKPTIHKLSPTTPIMETEKGYIVSDPSGVWVYLEEEPIDFEAPKNEKSVLGNFAGVSLECISLDKSLEFWQLFGFQVKNGSSEQGWISLENNHGMGLSLMKPLVCPHLFFNPSLTYFNGEENSEIIANVRKLQIPITEEISHFNLEGIVDNIIIRDPGGYGFFIFND